MGLFSRGERQRSSNPNNVLTADGGRSQTAAGERIRKDDVESIRRIHMPWQDRAFEYYDAGGPAWYAAQFYARMLAPLKLYPAVINDEGDLVPANAEDQDQEAAEIATAQLNRIQDPGGGRTSLLGTYGRLMFLNGEAYLFVSLDNEGNEQWEMLAPNELTVDDRSYVRRDSPGATGREYRRPDEQSNRPLKENEAEAFRLWRRHPRWSALADAPMKSALDDLEELLMMTRAVRARARSRMAGPGVLFMDDRISEAPPEPGPDEDPIEDKYLRDLTLAMTTPIANEGVASEQVPMLTRVPVPDGMKVSDMVYLLQITDPNELYQEIQMRMECIRRISIELDMPPEVLTGTADLNHWSAWLVDENTWKGHGEPVARQLVDDLTAAFYRPTLRELGVKNWPDHCIAFDPSGVVNHPDRAKDAKDLHDRLAISDEALRDANNFTEDDEPDDEERSRRIGVLIRDGSLAVYGIPSVKSGGIEPTEGEIVRGPDSGGTVDGGQSSSEAPKDMPAQPAGGTQAAGNGHGNGLMSQMVLGAAQAALLRAREGAGNRIRSTAKRDQKALAKIEGVRPGEVAVVLGRDGVHALGLTNEQTLVKAGHQLIADTLRSWGVSDPDLIDQIATQIEQYAARTLYEPRAVRLPAPLANYISGLAAGLVLA